MKQTQVSKNNMPMTRFVGTRDEFDSDAALQPFLSTLCKRLDGLYELLVPQFALGVDFEHTKHNTDKTLTGKDGRILFPLNQKWTIRGLEYDIYVDRYGKQYRRRVLKGVNDNGK